MIVNKICPICESEFGAETRELNRGNAKYCSRKCSGINNSQTRTQEFQPNTICAVCSKQYYLPSSKKASSKSGIHFCSRLCQSAGFADPEIPVNPGPKPIGLRPKYHPCISCQAITTMDRCRPCKTKFLISQWLSGDISVTIGKGASKETAPFVKKYLIKTRGDKCEVCGWDEKSPDGRSIIQMDHVDGNFLNNDLANLKLLCPNHHAMTPTYGSLNKNGGRTH